ncbi:alpha/beta hydrolase family protein [Roseibium sp.]|uniref:alpha/beta hydrolase family protein n=1 Tax=Roseibium sp. TaxID=1936156 RepID=UPI003D0BB64B
MTTINHHIIDRGDGAAVELFQAHPIGSGEPAGAILFVHGNQEGQLTGARELVDRGTLSTFAVTMNVTAAAVSQPGFGASDGPCDFCGPNTQDAIIAALNVLKNQPSIDSGRVVLYGHSRGAVAAGMVAARYDGLRAVVLSSGVYDLNAFHMDCADGLRIAIETEAGQSAQVFHERSALFHADKINTDMLLLHGRHDDRAPVEQAEAFSLALENSGGKVALKVLECGHRLPATALKTVVEPFLKEVLSAKQLKH